MVVGRLATLWVYVLELYIGSILKKANVVDASGLAGNLSMSNVRVAFESRVGGPAVPKARVGKVGCAVQDNAEGGDSCWVLEPDMNPRTLVVIIHEEAINQFLGMAYFGGIFSCREVNLKAMDYVLEYPYLKWTTIDVSRCWKLRDFFQFLVIHLVLACLE